MTISSSPFAAKWIFGVSALRVGLTRKITTLSERVYRLMLSDAADKEVAPGTDMLAGRVPSQYEF